MERLPGIDAGYLYMETPTLHMHTLKVSVVDPSSVPGGWSFDRFRAELDARLHLLPPFRRRLVDVPLGLHHPLWIEDPDFDLSNHLFRQVLPEPGGREEMDEAVARIAGRPLDRSRPLWEIWMLEGLEGGRVCFAAKIHHSVADGGAAAALLANVMQVGDDGAGPPPATHPWRADPVPSSTELIRGALRDHVRQLRRLPGLLVRTVRNVRRAARVRKAAAVAPPRPMVDCPATPYNHALEADRDFATGSLRFEDLRTVKNRLGVTLNDVFLGVVAGALRTTFLAYGVLPDKPLVAGVPVSTETATDEPRLHGNRVSNLFTSLCTDMADPVERVRAISAVTAEAKNVHQALGPEMLGEWSDFTPPRPFAFFMRHYSRSRMADRLPPPINLVVSNVAGPRLVLHAAGAKLEAIYSVGPILEGIGLNITAWSYIDQMNVAAISCPGIKPTLREIVEAMRTSLDELLDATDPTADIELV